MSYGKPRCSIFTVILVTSLITTVLLVFDENDTRDKVPPVLMTPRPIVSVFYKKPRPPPENRPPFVDTRKAAEIKNMSIRQHNDTQKSKVRTLLTYDQYGQLGNVMFQYASLLGVAKMNDRIPFVSPNSKLVRDFKISHVLRVPHHEKWLLIGEQHYAMYDPIFEHLPDYNISLLAYLQSYRYFQSVSDKVKKEFQFHDRIVKKADAMMASLRPKIGTRVTIGVHVRRRDKLWRNEIRKGEVTASKSYFSKAFRWMRDKYKNVIFLVASDDYDWCKRNIMDNDDVIMLPQSQREVHLCFLTKCNHMIMSVGTFGWWAGWLGGGDVIYYKEPVPPGSRKYVSFEPKDYFPPYWLGMTD